MLKVPKSGSIHAVQQGMTILTIHIANVPCFVKIREKKEVKQNATIPSSLGWHICTVSYSCAYVLYILCMGWYGGFPLGLVCYTRFFIRNPIIKRCREGLHMELSLHSILPCLAAQIVSPIITSFSILMLMITVVVSLQLVVDIEITGVGLG